MRRNRKRLSCEQSGMVSNGYKAEPSGEQKTMDSRSLIFQMN